MVQGIHGEVVLLVLSCVIGISMLLSDISYLLLEYGRNGQVKDPET
jgi:hypothetical protein